MRARQITLYRHASQRDSEGQGGIGVKEQMAEQYRIERQSAYVQKSQSIQCVGSCEKE